MRRCQALFVLIALLAGCGGDSTGPESYSFTGTWTSTATLSTGSNFVVNINATEAARSISGNGNFAATTGTVISVFTLTGTHLDANITLTIKSSGFEDLQFSGVYTDRNTVRGQFDGSGFNASAVVLTRK